MTDLYSRELMRGSLDLIVLTVLADGPKYGYLIQQKVRLASAGHVDVQAGTIYPLLHRLEAEKLVRCRWEDSSGRRRKWYELTAAGENRLKQQAEQWHVYAQCIGKLLEGLSVLTPPQPLPQ